MAYKPAGLNPGFAGLGQYVLDVDIDFEQAAWNTVASHRVFTVNSGIVRVFWGFYVSETLGSAGAATIAFGTSQNPTQLVAASAYSGFTVGTLIGGGGTTTGSIQSRAQIQDYFTGNATLGFYFSDNSSSGHHIGFTIAAAALNNGFMKARAVWSPMSPGAYLSAATGAAY